MCCTVNGRANIVFPFVVIEGNKFKEAFSAAGMTRRSPKK